MTRCAPETATRWASPVALKSAYSAESPSDPRHPAHQRLQKRRRVAPCRRKGLDGTDAHAEQQADKAVALERRHVVDARDSGGPLLPAVRRRRPFGPRKPRARLERVAVARGFDAFGKGHAHHERPPVRGCGAGAALRPVSAGLAVLQCLEAPDQGRCLFRLRRSVMKSSGSRAAAGEPQRNAQKRAARQDVPASPEGCGRHGRKHSPKGRHQQARALLHALAERIGRGRGGPQAQGAGEQGRQRGPHGPVGCGGRPPTPRPTCANRTCASHAR